MKSLLIIEHQKRYLVDSLWNYYFSVTLCNTEKQVKNFSYPELYQHVQTPLQEIDKAKLFGRHSRNIHEILEQVQNLSESHNYTFDHTAVTGGSTTKRKRIPSWRTKHIKPTSKSRATRRRSERYSTPAKMSSTTGNWTKNLTKSSSGTRSSCLRKRISKMCWPALTVGVSTKEKPSTPPWLCKEEPWRREQTERLLKTWISLPER